MPTEDEIQKVKLLAEAVQQCDIWITSNKERLLNSPVGSACTQRVVQIPTIYFDAFHPDLCYVRNTTNGEVLIPHYHSAIIAWAWMHGVSEETTLSMFREDIFDGLGYLDRWDQALARMRGEFERAGLSLADFFLPIKRKGVFMHSVNHPTNFALAQLGRVVATLISGNNTHLSRAIEIDDGLAGEIWPVYPGVADVFGVESSLIWKRGGKFFDLPGFIHSSFSNYVTAGVSAATIEIGRESKQRDQLDAVLGREFL